MIEVLFIATGVAILSWAFAKEKIFLELREFLTVITKDKKNHWFVRKICYMPTCEYCCSFWITIVAAVLFQSRLHFDDWRGNILFHLVTWAIAVVYMAIFQKIRVDIRNEQADADIKEKDL